MDSAWDRMFYTRLMSKGEIFLPTWSINLINDEGPPDWLKTIGDLFLLAQEVLDE